MTRDGTRPALDLATGRTEAESAAAVLATQLQDGLDAASADTYDACGSAPTSSGAAPTARPWPGSTSSTRSIISSSRHGTAPASRGSRSSRSWHPPRGVVVAHIRRRARREDGFSEMALYVLVKRDGTWWLAAAQNTPAAQQRESAPSCRTSVPFSGGPCPLPLLGPVGPACWTRADA